MHLTGSPIINALGAVTAATESATSTAAVVERAVASTSSVVVLHGAAATCLFERMILPCSFFLPLMRSTRECDVVKFF